MKQTVIGSRLLAGAVALALLAALALPGTAAATSADATILNVVTVTYKDAGGVTSYSATASASVTVDLLASPLDPGGPPTATNPGGTVNPECPAAPYGSGTTARLLYALTATANGLDTYDLVLGNVPDANLNISSISHQTLEWDGNARPGNPDPATDDLGSAHVVGVVDADTLQFPGGSLATAGFAVDDIVVVNSVAYLVASISTAPGNVPTHTNLGGAPQTTPGTTNAETYDNMTLKAYPVTAILAGAYSVGSGSAPDFVTTPPAAGDVVGEMVLVLVEVSATVTSGASGDTVFTLTTTDADGGTSTISCPVSFQATSLSIQKDVCNDTVTLNCTNWGGTASGKPGEVLRYRVSIANTGSNATDVKVTDDVPAYTTLNISGVNFALVGTNGGAPSVTITTTADDNANEDVTIATGNLDSSTLNFFIGTGNSDNAVVGAAGNGGTVTSTTTYQIYYKVTID